MTADEIRGALQAILFVAGEPVSIDQLSDALGDASKEAVEAELESFCDRLERFFVFAVRELRATPSTFMEFRHQYCRT